MTQGKRYVVLGFAVLAMGAARMPFERQLTAELQAEGLLAPKLEVRTGERIGQTFYAVSLGGLRTLVATFMNLRAFTFFTEQKWAEVAETYDTIVDLAPRTRYYWDTGSWHQAYNAASDYLYGETHLSPLRRKVAWRDYIIGGRDFLEKGIRNNPDDAALRESLGYLLADPNKIAAFGDPGEAFEASYEVYMAAVETGTARSFAKRAALYSLARVPGREKEALELALDIKATQGQVPPTVLGLLYTLRYHQDPEQPVMELVDSVFPSRKIAYRILGDQWLRTRDRFPVHGVAKAVTRLERLFKVPVEDSVLKQERYAPMDPDEFFSGSR